VFSSLLLEQREETAGLSPMQVLLQLPLQTGYHPAGADGAMPVCLGSFGWPDGLNSVTLQRRGACQTLRSRTIPYRMKEIHPIHLCVRLDHRVEV
jgi:hypothetical protein